jgi:VIT1/CCC1 family predicted Fe2+/Mn2+ transporter
MPALAEVDAGTAAERLIPHLEESKESLDADELIPVRVKRYRWVPPPASEVKPYEAHQGDGSQYLRDMILGVNDGLISTFLIVVGVVAGGASTTATLLAGIASAIAGALSMGIGEFIATKSQNAVNVGEMAIEREHFKYHRDVELQQLRSFLESVNLSGNLLEAVVSHVGKDDDSLMRMMMAFEFGASSDDLERNPWSAMWASGRLFFIGSLPSVIPFFFGHFISATTCLAIATALVGVSLFVVGALKTMSTKGRIFFDGMENFTLGAFAGGVAYAVGYAFFAVTGDSQAS